ncbi:MAG: acyl carrier protein [Lachnospiraceae bacterium]|nr:acyl carrier protein [Lachnospiraceae bacterium]
MIRKQILEILEDVCPGVDIENQTALFDDGIIASFDVIHIMSELMDVFNIEIDADDIEPENINSLDALVKLVESRLA